MTTQLTADFRRTEPDYEGQFRGALTAARLHKAAELLNEMAARSRRSDGELVAAATSYPDPDVQNAAVALFHARTGQITPETITPEHVAAVEFMEALSAK